MVRTANVNIWNPVPNYGLSCLSEPSFKVGDQLWQVHEGEQLFLLRNSFLIIRCQKLEASCQKVNWGEGRGWQGYFAKSANCVTRYFGLF